MNGWRFVLGLLGALNLALLLGSLLSGGYSLRVIDAPGMRADLVKVERPWKDPVLIVLPVSPPAPRINLKEGQAKLDSAIQNASKQVFDNPRNNQKCRIWGPLLPNESGRVQASLASWNGKTERLERPVPVGYVVYLPQNIVNSGVGLDQLSDKGIKDMFFINTPGPLQGTISLGLFRDLERANVQKEELARKGVEGAQIRERLGPTRIFFELRGTPAQIDAAEGIFNLNRRGELKVCEV